MFDRSLFRELFHRRGSFKSTPSSDLPTTLNCQQQLFGIPSQESFGRSSLDNVIIVGNCIAEGMAAGLSASREAASQFSFVGIPLHLKSMNDQGTLDALATASYVFVQQLGAIDWNFINRAVPVGCKIFQFPGVVLNDLWPFDPVSGCDDKVARSRPDGSVRHFDGALARLREIQPDKKKRIALYTSLEFDWANKITTTAVAQTQFLHDIDRRSDCHIGRFIERYRRERQLFYNAAHPSELVFQELCEWCWRKLGIETVPPTFTQIDGWKDWSVPVHPLIARHVGAVWAHEATRYKYVTLGEITWKEWVEIYVDEFG